MKEWGALVRKAEKFVDTAKMLLDYGDYDSCVSRCYYAMFFLVEAVLMTKGLRPTSHKGAITLFGQHFVKLGVFDRELGKVLTEAYDKRLLGDYAVGISISREEAEDLLARCERFLDELKGYLESLDT